MQDSNKHSLKWWMFLSWTLEASVFIGKKYLEKLNSIKNTGNDLTLKRIFANRETRYGETRSWNEC